LSGQVGAFDAGLGRELLYALLHALEPDNPGSLDDGDDPDLSQRFQSASIAAKCGRSQ